MKRSLKALFFPLLLLLLCRPSFSFPFLFAHFISCHVLDCSRILFHATFFIVRAFYFLPCFGLYAFYFMIRWEGLPERLVRVALMHFVSCGAQFV